MKTIREVVAHRRLHCIGPQSSVRDAAKLMANHNVGAVVVIENDSLAGILTERDIIFRVVGCDLSVDATKTADVMTTEPVTVEIEEPISKALATKLGNAFRHLPVMDNGKVVGLLSYRDMPAEYVMMFERFREMSSSRADGNS